MTMHCALFQIVLISLLISALVGGGIITAARSQFWRFWRTSDWLGLALCLSFAFLIRIYARTFPSDLQLASSQGSSIHAHQWAAGFSAILRLLFMFLPSNVETVAKMNVLIGTLTVAVVFAFVVAYFQDRLAAFSAAAVLACQPISARYAASDSPYVLLTFCFFLSCLFIVLWVRHGGYSLLLQGMGWMAVAANVRNEAVLFVVAVCFVFLGALGRKRNEKKTAQFLWAVLLSGIFFIYPATMILLELSGHGDFISPFGFGEAFFLSQHSPTTIACMALLGLLWALKAYPWRTSCFLMALVIVSLPTGFLVLPPEQSIHFHGLCATKGWYGMLRLFLHEISSYLAISEVRLRHVLPHLAAWSVFAGCGFRAAADILSHRFRRMMPVLGNGAARALTPLAGSLILTTALLSCVSHRGFLTKIWTYALEYNFIVVHLGDIPDDCIMVRPGLDDQHRGLCIISQLSNEVGRNHRWVTACELADLPMEQCVVFYRAASCRAWEDGKRDWTGTERPVCQNVQERFELEPLATTRLPSLPYAWERYATDPVPVGFYRLKARRHPGILAN